MFSVLVFLAVLSVLVFVHELGHFLAAKACGIYVDRFSIGMPPRVIGIRLGETDYCISLLPIGGYVKMAGQEDTPLSEEEREQEYGHVPPERWFNNKPVWQRYVVTVAGPLMNLVLAVFIYAGIAMWGTEVDESEIIARVGEVESTMPAASAPLYLLKEGADASSYDGTPDAVGWHTGDIVRSVNGREVRNIMDVAIKLVLAGPGKEYHVRIDRPAPDGSLTKYVSVIRPELSKDGERPRFGIGPYQTAKVAALLPGLPAEKSGLEIGDIIVAADGAPVDRTTFIQKTEEVPEGGTLSVTVLRKGEPLTFSLSPATMGRVKDADLFAADDEAAGLQVLAVKEEYAKDSGLQRKDVITTLNGEPATPERLRALALAQSSGAITAEVERPAILFGLVQRASTLTVELPLTPVRAIGATLKPEKVYQRYSPPAAILEGFHQSYQALETTVLTVKALVTHTVSPKDIGGPMMIYTVTSKAAEVGFAWLLKITAFISVNLCVLNLLPIPVLDGGLLVIHGYEGIFRRPLSMKFQERFQQVGLVLILALMLFVTWNDVLRWFEDITP